MLLAEGLSPDGNSGPHRALLMLFFKRGYNVLSAFGDNRKIISPSGEEFTYTIDDTMILDQVKDRVRTGSIELKVLYPSGEIVV